MKIHVSTIPGNFFDAQDWLNVYKLGEYLVQMTLVGNYTQIVLKLPLDLLEKLQIEKVLRK